MLYNMHTINYQINMKELSFFSSYKLFEIHETQHEIEWRVCMTKKMIKCI